MCTVGDGSAGVVYFATQEGAVGCIELWCNMSGEWRATCGDYQGTCDGSKDMWATGLGG